MVERETSFQKLVAANEIECRSAGNAGRDYISKMMSLPIFRPVAKAGSADADRTTWRERPREREAGGSTPPPETG